jgi:hypothetical protein
MNARAIIGSLVLATFAALLAGCEPAGPVTTQGVLTRTAVNPPLPPPPPGSPTPEVVRKTNPFDRAEAPRAEAPVTAPPVADPTYSPAEPTNSSPKPSIKLSVGIALPQTLPDGTQVGVSVDYKVTGRLNTSAKYVLVVESRAGETIFDVKLSPQGGNLAGFLPLSIRPEHSPFRARIDEVSSSGSGATISNIAPLQ